MKIVFDGDPAQLGPTSGLDDKECTSFDTRYLRGLEFEVFSLFENRRQRDEDFKDILSQVRLFGVTDDLAKRLKLRQGDYNKEALVVCADYRTYSAYLSKKDGDIRLETDKGVTQFSLGEKILFTSNVYNELGNIIVKKGSTIGELVEVHDNILKVKISNKEILTVKKIKGKFPIAPYGIQTARQVQGKTLTGPVCLILIDLQESR
jgi:hypothetical protein